MKKHRLIVSVSAIVLIFFSSLVIAEPCHSKLLLGGHCSDLTEKGKDKCEAHYVSSKGHDGRHARNCKWSGGICKEVKHRCIKS